MHTTKQSHIAFQDFLPKLEEHLLSRIQSILRKENGDLEHDNHMQGLHGRPRNSILFKSDRIYPHKIMRINYTTYDTRRSQDVINPSTPHRDIMMLNDSFVSDDHQQSHPYCYARVLGIYHANIIYAGPGMIDYQAKRMEFLWVRWYRHTELTQISWGSHRLDRIQFPPMAEDDSFGFVDPSDVIRGCHIIPAFSGRKVHTDGKGLSFCAQDSLDWVSYYVNRCVILVFIDDTL